MSIIAQLRGTIEEKGPQGVILNVGGVGFRVHVPLSTLDALGAVGEAARLRTHLHFREDTLALYGFASGVELAVFEELISVSGVGPKAALALLSLLGAAAVAEAIASGDVGRLTRVPGIGQKTASRLVLELRGRLAGLAASRASGGEDEVVAALTGLGYTQMEASEAVAAIPGNGASAEERLRQALRYLGSRG